MVIACINNNMSLYILKFGGSSVATINRIKNVANIIANLKKQGNNIIVVTSAMHGVTDKLLEYTKDFICNISNDLYYRESDAIVSCGESIAAGILALALKSIGIPAKSFNSWQIPIEASSNYSNATITNIKTDILFETLNNDIVPVITGFQGLSLNNDIVTLGRGGSDATACALAYYTKADECYIYTDVSGVFTADPRVVTNAKRLECISYDEMIELAKYGAKVLQYKSVLIAKEYNVKVRVLSSFNCNTNESDNTKNRQFNNSITTDEKYVKSSLATDKKNSINSVNANSDSKHYMNIIESSSNDIQSSLVTNYTKYINKFKTNTTGTKTNCIAIAGIAHNTNYVLLNTKTNIDNILEKYEIINIKNYNYLVKKSILNNILHLLNRYTIDNDIGTITIVGNINKEQNSNNSITENIHKINCINNNDEIVSMSKNINNIIIENIQNNKLYESSDIGPENFNKIDVKIIDKIMVEDISDNIKLKNINNNCTEDISNCVLKIVNTKDISAQNIVNNKVKNISKNNLDNTTHYIEDTTKIDMKNSDDNKNIENSIICTCDANNIGTHDNIVNNNLRNTNDMDIENPTNLIVELDTLLIRNNINIKYKFIDNLSITYIVHLSQTETVLNIIHNYIYD